MNTRADATFKTVLQIVAIVLLALIVAVILHKKRYADVSEISREHSGADSWRALARHVFKNLSAA